MSEERKLKAENYEEGFRDALLDFIKKDGELKRFYQRFLLECENISNVIEKAESESIESGLKKLKNTNSQFINPNNDHETLAKIDTTFHEDLFNITNDFRLFDMQLEIRREGGAHYKIWQSISRNGAHYNELCTIHSEIVEAIEKKNKNTAINAMQKHFAIVLIHYIQQLKPKPSVNKGKAT